ncbi:MAG: hypothetical protein ACREFP_00460 [Acetobacteraceae bacterium]
MPVLAALPALSERASAAETIKIGFNLPLTGNSAAMGRLIQQAGRGGRRHHQQPSVAPGAAAAGIPDLGNAEDGNEDLDKVRSHSKERFRK